DADLRGTRKVTPRRDNVLCVSVSDRVLGEPVIDIDGLTDVYQFIVEIDGVDARTPRQRPHGKCVGSPGHFLARNSSSVMPLWTRMASTVSSCRSLTRSTTPIP